MRPVPTGSPTNHHYGDRFRCPFRNDHLRRALHDDYIDFEPDEFIDDRATPVEYLRETLAARQIILGQYGSGMLKPGEPFGELRNIRMWMAYLHHRWAIESSLQYVGGMFHNLVVKGESLPPTQIVPAATQRDVLKLLMEAIGPYALPNQLPHADHDRWNEPPIGPDYAAPLAPQYFNWRKISIYGGSNEIQKNIIAKAVLGL